MPQARIYGVEKSRVELRVYVTDAAGRVWLGIGTRRFVQRLTTNAGFDRFYL